MESDVDVARPPLHVVAGILHDADGRVLLAQRPVGKAFAGRWEFPGGKLEPGESPRDALERELREELGIEVRDAEPLLCARHHYPDAPRAVLIDSWRVTRWSGVPASLDGQGLQWCAPCELPDVDILEADRPIVTALRLPSWIVRGAHEAPRGARSLRVAVSAQDVQLDPEAAPLNAIAIWSSVARLKAAHGPHGLSGCVVTNPKDAASAVTGGADFLIVPTHPGPEDMKIIGALGVPWYLEADVDASRSTPPTGRLRWT